MLCKSKITKTKNKHILCKLNETLAIISKSKYEYKEGYFYLLINVRDEVFILDENDIFIDENFTNKILAFNRNKKPIFDDYILEQFEL